ncbi:adenylosuccinate lyase [Candidatus Caldatribacterium sp.]|uniref:adenylosuccinate lyase n=1 Tax=Candidatus Caldatribacterium sp. TaxID=2282143 RepID=UPI002991DCDE|nr:adenylosuccinate lyase [Candidatus Caldatribacterium sp.]MDW8080869.1 adenylosuccinate lyase [Candidatus Calescibacterium sp.]
MIERYTLPRMQAIWSDVHRFEIWIRIEMLVLEAWEKLGVIPKEEVERIRSRLSFSPERMKEIEKITKHDVIAFLTSLAENLGRESRFLHFGLTSSDVLDTANAVLLRESADLLLEDVEKVLKAIRKRAWEHRYTLMVGRTHGVHAEPTTLGLKFAVWYAEMQRNKRRLEEAKRTISVGKISGAVGNFANVDPRVEAYVCEHLGLDPDPVSTQIVQRDRYAEFLWVLAMIGASLEKFALEIRHLQRTEVREVEEGFSPGQKGSSAMPHKKNPITAEQICGLSRLLRGNLLVALENIPLWHERDISHSSAERVILPDSCILADYLLNTFARLLEELIIYPDAMRKNLERSRGLVFSERVLLGLVGKGLTREEAYTIVQRCALRVWDDEQLTFLEALSQDPEVRRYFSREDLSALFDYEYYLKHVDTIMKRVGIWEEEESV